jgi:hypothetical protein
MVSESDLSRQLQDALIGGGDAHLSHLIRLAPPELGYRKFKELVTTSYIMIGSDQDELVSG